jgi:hypothetical protein
MKEGLGTYTYANGNKYVGSFKNGKKHGSGVLYYIDGTLEEGRWENDVLVSSNPEKDDSAQEGDTQE